MDIKDELNRLVCHAMDYEVAGAVCDYDDQQLSWQLLNETLDAINRWADMANAAVAYMEHQANPPEGGLTDTHAYFHKLAELGKAFMEARAKAKGMGNEST